MTLHDLRLNYAKFIKDIYHPKLVYYPACGSDTVPKTVFGENNVIHLSLPEHGSHTPGGYNYFQLLGDGVKLYGDMDKSPLAEDSIDLIWLKLGGITPSAEALNDFKRILKPWGYIYIEEYHFYEVERWNKLINLFKDYQNITPTEFNEHYEIYTISPKEFANNPKSLEEYEKNSEICKDEEEMKNIVSSQHLHFGTIELPRRAVFKKV